MLMEKRFVPADHEQRLYDFWEGSGLMTADVSSRHEPFSIILPPPNANADLHLGHAMYVYEDIMVRYAKMNGQETLWLPGADHAGFETQFVYEQHLAKKGRSRLDYTREELYKMIWDFVHENRGKMENQLRKLGFFLDWTRRKFTLDPDIIKIVYETFRQLFDDGLVYRAKRLVNYCPHCGTSFSDLEVVYKERTDPLYYLKYGPFVLATTRPETKFGDTAVAVHPDDERYRQWVGKEVEVEGLAGKFKLKVVADRVVDPKFGTGVVKVTPAHDFTDFEIGERHNLPMKQVIDFHGRLNELAGLYQGMTIKKARERIVADLSAKGLMVKIKEDYRHRIGTCYKCGGVIEPLPREQWFVKVRPLADKAVKLVEKDKIKVYPKRFRKILIDWLNNFHDWNISRQIVWGIRIPAYYCESKKEWFVSTEEPNKCQLCGQDDFVAETDTFDTWFSSAQWPFATLQTTKPGDFAKFYPTSVMETGYDILPWWVARMIMIGVYKTGEIPFRNVFLHGMVRDEKGQKMSKSKGNVINPLSMVEKYGADALRAALVFGVKEGSDLSLSEEKIIGMRNFANKIWNIGRFLSLNLKDEADSSLTSQKGGQRLAEITSEFSTLTKKYHRLMKSYRFSQALGDVYEFLWHRFADFYIEELKDEVRSGNIEVLGKLKKVYLDSLSLLHPFIPFVTEAAYQEFKGSGASLLVSEM